MSDAPAHFLDVSRLLEASLPRPRPQWLWYGMIGFMTLLLTTTLAPASNPQAQLASRALGGVMMFGLVTAMGFYSSYLMKQQRAEQQRVEAVEELLQLRRWDQAAAMLDTLLSQPARTMGARMQALIYLASVLARYHRFADAIAVANYLLEQGEFDAGSGHGIRLMRAMALLHEDQLVDADRAMNELRREAPDSAGLALVEIYRDVKTGHPAEAIEVFDARLPVLRSQLGHRAADAYALVARAHDLLGREADAAAAFERATLLSPAEELYRRYPEVAAMRDRYPAATAPTEAAA
jgi:tetratricopeptide (TPR) repeat protein